MSDFLSRDVAAIIHFSDKNKTIVRKFRYIFFFVVDLYANLYLYLKKKLVDEWIVIFK